MGTTFFSVEGVEGKAPAARRRLNDEFNPLDDGADEERGEARVKGKKNKNPVQYCSQCGLQFSRANMARHRKLHERRGY